MRQQLCVNDLNPAVFCANASGLIGVQDGFAAFSITDGATTEIVNPGDTVTFSDTSSIDFTVSATDTVAAAVKLSATAGNDLVINADGLYLSKNDLVTGATWDDATNTLTLTFDSGATVDVPFTDTVAAFLSDFTVAGNAGTPDLVNNHETLSIVGAADSGVITTITDNTVTIDFDCSEPLDVSSLPTC